MSMHVWIVHDKIRTEMAIQTMSLHWQDNSKQMGVLGCNKNNNDNWKQTI